MVFSQRQMFNQMVVTNKNIGADTTASKFSVILANTTIDFN